MLRPVPRKNNYRAPWILVAPSIVSRRRNGRAAIVLKITTFALRTTVGRCHLPAPLSPRVTTFLVGSAVVPFSDFSPRYSFVRRTRRIAQLPFHGPFVFEIQPPSPPQPWRRSPISHSRERCALLHRMQRSAPTLT